MRIRQVITAQEAFANGSDILRDYQKLLMNVVQLLERCHTHKSQCVMGEMASKKPEIWSDFRAMTENVQNELEQMRNIVYFPVVPDPEEYIDPDATVEKPS